MEKLDIGHTTQMTQEQTKEREARLKDWGIRTKTEEDRLKQFQAEYGTSNDFSPG
jgi:hypothetical protein